MHPNILILLGFITVFCYENKLPCKITSLKTDRVAGRISTSHKEGRAADFSIKGWPKNKIIELETKMNGKYYDIAALSKSDKIPRACIVHGEDANKHIHLQVKP